MLQIGALPVELRGLVAGESTRESLRAGSRVPRLHLTDGVLPLHHRRRFADHPWARSDVAGLPVTPMLLSAVT